MRLLRALWSAFGAFWMPQDFHDNDTVKAR